MQANSRSIPVLFDSQLRYVVPMFQRLYVWKESPQWQTLWEDISEKASLRLAGKAAPPHYLGALIIEGVKPVSPQEVKRFLVVDGQQRLTTLQILLCSFRDLARERGWKSIDKPLTRYTENPDADVMEKPEEEVFKLWPTTLNRDVFRSVLQAGSQAEVEKRHPLVYIGRRRKPEPRNNLVDAYLYFFNRVSSWIASTNESSGKTNEQAAFALLQALQEDFSVVEIALSEGDDSQEIIYSLNSQGAPLSQSDLLRSLIFMRAEKEKQNRDDIFKDYWSKFETPFWSTDIKRGGRTYSRLDLGLRFFLMAKTGELIDARRVNEEYRRWISADPPRYPSIRAELADFSAHGDVYTSYESAAGQSLPCTDFRRMLADFDVSTALPLVMFLEKDAGLDETQKQACLATLESFIARRYFTGEENKEYNKFFVEVVGEVLSLRAAAVLPALKAKLLAGKGGSTRHWPTDNDLVDKAINRDVYNDLNRAGLRLILERIELSLRNKKSEGTDIAAGLQIEHVLPQTWSADWELQGKVIPGLTAKYPHLAEGEFVPFVEAIGQRNRSLQTIGNLTLLNQYLNPAASNGSFDLKLFEYRNSVLRLNRYFSEFTAWDEQAIVSRGKQFGEMLCAIWPRPSPPV